MAFTPQYIAPQNAGLQLNKKPFLLVDAAWQQLMNAYIFRDRVKKREGLKLVGRLRRVFSSVTVANQAILMGTTTINLKTLLGITEANAQIEPGNITTIVITIGAQVFTDSTGTATMTGFTAPVTNVFINYSTGILTILSGGAIGAAATTITLAYYPMLPCMGITPYNVPGVNTTNTILYDTVYPYTFVSSKFQQLGNFTWNAMDFNFFYSTNYQGVTADIRLYFVTNFVPNDASNPMAYYNGTTWNSFIPQVDATNYLTTCLILIPYYGRLLAFNTWEGPNTYATSVNYFNRCRFSQIGSPVNPDSWRSDEFGKGGFIDAPINEEILGVEFYKNTLIVFFETTTWLLRYVGEYGLPFLWERISTDYGCDSTFSPVVFDQGVMAIGNRAIIISSGNDVNRIDLDIPDVVFAMQNANHGRYRIQGVRDFRKELVYWCYGSSEQNQIYPNYSLVYNYRNNTFAIFRNNVTAFGYLQSEAGITWDSPDVTWDDDVSWDTFIQTNYSDVISGNQQGFIHYYGEPTSDPGFASSLSTFDQESLAITAINLTTQPIQITVPNHNLQTDETIYIDGLLFIDTTNGTFYNSSLNNQIYLVNVIDANTLGLFIWNFTTQQYYYDFAFTPTIAGGQPIYMGGGLLALYPKMDMITKDFNPYGQQGLEAKFGHLDLLTDATANALVSVNLYNNASLAAASNVLVGNRESNTALTSNGIITNVTNANPCQITSQQQHGLANGDQVQIGAVIGTTQLNGVSYVITIVDLYNFTLNVDSSAFGVYGGGGEWIQINYPFYTSGSNYTWHRFYGGTRGNFFSVELTYDDNLMNTFNTHQQDFVLNAMRIWSKPGGAGTY